MLKEIRNAALTDWNKKEIRKLAKLKLQLWIKNVKKYI